MSWTTKVTGFAVAAHAGSLLMIRHDRLGVVRWELPGGHVEAGESVEAAAAREVWEETGVRVEIGELAGTCVHEWVERKQRRVILYYAAVPVDPVDPAAPLVPRPEDGILSVAWQRPDLLPVDEISPFLHPLLRDWPRLPVRPLLMRADHVLDASGKWTPRLLEVA